MGGNILVIDQGTTSTRAIVFDDARDADRFGAEGVSADLSASRLDRARSGGHLGDDHRRRRARRWRRVGGPRRSPPSASPTSARRRSSGTAGRRAGLQRHRLAGPPHGRALRRTPARAVTARWSPSAPGLVLDPYFSATKIAWILDNVARRARARGARRPRVRDRRFLPALAPDGRRRARDRRDQRLAHLAPRHPTRATWDDDAPRPLRRSARRCCPRCATRRARSA